MVNTPYGGKLKISMDLGNQEKHLEDAKDMVSIEPFIDFFYDSLKIADGSYSPLDGFMGDDEIKSVGSKSRLLNDLPWTIPIFLAVGEEDYRKVKPGDEVALLDSDHSPFGVLNIEMKFPLNKKEIAQSTYGTIDIKHPNVEDLFHKYGDYALSGKVRVFREPPLPGGTLEKHPAEAREQFKKMGWKNIVAYQARNPPHVAHEYLQKVSLEFPGIDGLFIHLVVGRLKRGDYKADVILDTYETLIKNYHRKENAFLGSLSITMRYAGPKASIFLAIIRRNYGATHFIIGRDQAGVGNFYGPYAGHRIFDEIDVGVTPLKFTNTFYCRKCRGIASENVCPHDVADRVMISQTKIREMLKAGEKIPEEIIRPEIAEILGRGNAISE